MHGAAAAAACMPLVSAILCRQGSNGHEQKRRLQYTIRSTGMRYDEDLLMISLLSWPRSYGAVQLIAFRHRTLIRGGGTFSK